MQRLPAATIRAPRFLLGRSFHLSRAIVPSLAGIVRNKLERGLDGDTLREVRESHQRRR